MAKKKLNIPIGDVAYDEEYEQNVAATYCVPSILIRHARKVGDESDLLIDYVVENDDLVWLKTNPKFVNDKEITKHMTTDAFEILVNLFEKLTGMSEQPVALVSMKE